MASLLIAGVASSAIADESQCHGAINNGRIDGAVQIPQKGPNFEVMSWSAEHQRTFVHTAVEKIIVESYAAVAAVIPDSIFLVGESGLQNGGPITHHFTHQRGTSVDFFVPVKNLEGKRVLIPHYLDNGFGYKVRFNAEGKTTDGRYVLDFEALGEHLYQLNETAKQNGHGIDSVILVRELQAKLFDTKHGSYLKWKLYFFDDPGERHDNHIHVDFNIPCALF